jgi:hypothetical protein
LDTLGHVPTTRQRYLITESDRLKVALDDAARRWPEVTSRAQLLVRLAEEGHDVLLGTVSESAAARRAVIERTSGAMTGVYEPGFLEALRQEWPA